MEKNSHEAMAGDDAEMKSSFDHYETIVFQS